MPIESFELRLLDSTPQPTNLSEEGLINMRVLVAPVVLQSNATSTDNDVLGP